MNVTVFRLHNPICSPEGDPTFGAHKAIYKVPTLPAYALIDSQLELEGNLHIDAGYIPIIYEVQIDRIVIPNRNWDIFGSPSGLLTVYHNGIKDFELLFPHVTNNSLRHRIARFAEEAEKAFESQSWISYCLMVGGVLEGLLYNEFGNQSFLKLIEKALQSSLITSEESLLIDDVRVTRNKIHACKHPEEIANRKIALELSTAYDRLIKRDWSAALNESKT